MAKKDGDIRTHLLKAGAKNLREFGYPDVTPENIMDSMVTRMFFESMLDENIGNGSEIDKVINELKAEIKAKE